ncbi:substrate-binding domain-containing protein [Candidatus Bathyarchaeota archaeon]|nr:MAG: substrate-binding domain-containing protein [Candidatus Bathyarchaeota archaeon]
MEEIRKLNENLPLLSRRVTRRQAISSVAKAAMGVAAAAVVGGGAYAAYVASQAATQASKTTTTTSSTATTSSGEQLKFGLVSFSLSDPAPAAWRDGWVASCNALGVQPLVFDYGFDASKALEAVRNYAASGVQAIWVQAPTNDIIPSIAQVAEENKVYVGWIWNYLPNQEPWTYGSGKYVLFNRDVDGIFDHRVPARAVFQYMKNEGKGNGKAFLISGRQGQILSNVRDYAVWYEWTKFYPDVDLRGFLYGQWSIEPAIDATNQMVAKHGNPDGCIGANDAIAIGMARALDAFNVKVPTAGSDAQLPALKIMLEGKGFPIIVDAGFNLAYDGGASAAMFYDVVKGSWYPKDGERIQICGMIGLANDVDKTKALLGDLVTQFPYKWFSVQDYQDQVINKPPGPWNWKAMSIAKAEAEGITFDRTGGGAFGSTVYPVSQTPFGTTDKFNQLYGDQQNKTPADYWGNRANNG